MALSKAYTFSSIESHLRVLVDEIAPSKILSDTIKSIVNKNLLDIAEMLNGASIPDYGQTAVLSDAAGSSATPVTSSASYQNSTKRVTHSGHGLTSASLGKRVALLGDSGLAEYMGIGTLTAIISTSIFEVSFALGADIASNYLSYVILPAHSAAFLDLSGLKVDKIIKVVDSTSGLVSERNDLTFEGLQNNDQMTRGVFYNHFGEYLYLYKGSNVTSWGTLTVYYYRIPTLVTAVTDYIDIKDKYIPLLIDKCKVDIYELAKMAPPKEITQSVEAKTQLIRQANADKQNALLDKKR